MTIEFGRMSDLVDRRFSNDVPPPDLSSLEAWAREHMRAPAREEIGDPGARPNAASSAARGTSRPTSQPIGRYPPIPMDTGRTLFGERDPTSSLVPHRPRSSGISTGT
jgi:hypothetical protein